jgi:ubiquinol-cytochrome c reductase cytochrome b subunit
MIRNVIDWLEDRIGIESAVKRFMNEDIPGSSGWHQVFGSIALFLFLTQVFTGIMLAFNYAPTPGEAYNSLKYIVTELTAGRLMRGLHHWGASMMIVIVVLHLIQTFVWGAYKKPREATWLLGVVLLLVTLAFGLTGYLLPWDNRAYWGTVVTTQIAGQAPVMGKYMQRLMGVDGGGVGVVTFARFYAVHVLLLPPITTLLIGIHVFLVRKHGVAPAPVETKPKKKFYPEQVFKDTVAIFIVFVILFTLAIAAKVPIGKLADPTDTSYIPRPEWYFLFLFQTLKFFEGPLEVIGSVVLPTVAILALFATPFIDRGAAIRVGKRTTAIAFVLLAAIGWSGLTLAAIRSTPAAPPDVEESEGPQDWQQLSPEELAGIGYFRKEDCAACHSVGDGKSSIGPDLASRPIKRDAKWMIQHFKTPQSIRPGTSMPPIRLKDSQLNSLAAFLLKLNAKNQAALQSAPQFVVEGAILYQTNLCYACHQINNVGTKLGPKLNGLAQRRSRDWVEQHFLDPQKMSPGTVMPAYKFSPKDMDRMSSFLMALGE